ncbi:hypothetical protein JCM5296_005911 [Sporobolomyces johnsonii]
MDYFDIALHNFGRLKTATFVPLSEPDKPDPPEEMLDALRNMRRWVGRVELKRSPECGAFASEASKMASWLRFQLWRFPPPSDEDSEAHHDMVGALLAGWSVIFVWVVTGECLEVHSVQEKQDCKVCARFELLKPLLHGLLHYLTTSLPVSSQLDRYHEFRMRLVDLIGMPLSDFISIASRYIVNGANPLFQVALPPQPVVSSAQVASLFSVEQLCLTMQLVSLLPGHDGYARVSLQEKVEVSTLNDIFRRSTNPALLRSTIQLSHALLPQSTPPRACAASSAPTEQYPPSPASPAAHETSQTRREWLSSLFPARDFGPSAHLLQAQISSARLGLLNDAERAILAILERTDLRRPQLFKLDSLVYDPDALGPSEPATTTRTSPTTTSTFPLSLTPANTHLWFDATALRSTVLTTDVDELGLPRRRSP